MGTKGGNLRGIERGGGTHINHAERRRDGNQVAGTLVELDGEPVRRAYSACSSHLDPGQVAITVKRVAGGRVSNHLNQEAPDRDHP